jgi:hypothetical protein
MNITSSYEMNSPRKVFNFRCRPETDGGVILAPITVTQYQRFQFIRDQLAKEGVTLALSTGN